MPGYSCAVELSVIIISAAVYYSRWRVIVSNGPTILMIKRGDVVAGWSVAGDQDKGRNIDLGCLVIDEASLLLLHWHCSADTQTYRRYTLHCCSTSWLDALQPIWSSEENCIHRHTLRKLYNDATSSDKWAHGIITRVWWLLVEVKWSLCRLLDIMHYSLLTTNNPRHL